MRAARLINMVLLLQSRGMLTAGELAAELEVSERTVYRDALALSAAGVPVYAEQGRTGGYRLVGGYRTRLTGLSHGEAEALFLAGLPGPARDMGLDEPVQSVRRKVLAALPPGLREASQRAGQRFHLDAPGWFDRADPPEQLAELARAVWQDRVLTMRYRRRDEEVGRDVEPYGLVLKSGVWYLVGRVDADLRTYRVDRITGVEPTGAGFTRDPEFDLPEFWAQRAAEFVRQMLRTTITIRLSPDGLRGLRFVAEPPAVREALEVAGEPDRHGWVRTRLPVESLDVGYTYMLRLGPEVEVLEPPALRERFADAARRLGDLYR
ncbi:helix-turn-helix transcriptional regulator [Actinoplanes xinjiangensis]|uniref:Putative DNA-binding transcriptional regulator YafY n=1 Tax=Actinoplanes xinjiangensis TaxID=512350 RepID=A0A316F6L5_9ACTN|nr:YafY family protein [Actinoplanes xinjiangensis]PWK40070.1 putative DNA-binding transcriptional regulator YafY [Actinoplanes xinjiangensis]GIF42381.1 transcriptional regulator [Actinoplanes xinjiangensis]